VHDPVGGVLLRHSGYFDTTVFVEAVRVLLKKAEAYGGRDSKKLNYGKRESGVSYRKCHGQKK